MDATITPKWTGTISASDLSWYIFVANNFSVNVKTGDLSDANWSTDWWLKRSTMTYPHYRVMSISMRNRTWMHKIRHKEYLTNILSSLQQNYRQMQDVIISLFVSTNCILNIFYLSIFGPDTVWSVVFDTESRRIYINDLTILYCFLQDGKTLIFLNMLYSYLQSHWILLNSTIVVVCKSSFQI